MSESAHAYVAFFLETTRLTPGRIRLRIPQKRGNSSFFEALSAQVKELEHVIDVKANTITSSLLIVHASDGHAILTELDRQRILRLRRREQVPPVEFVTHLTEKEKATLRFVTFTGLTLYQMWQGRIFAAASALAMEARDYWKQIPFEDMITEVEQTIAEDV